MKVNILDAHDRLTFIKNQEMGISESIQSFINQRPFGDHNFYLLAHPRTSEDGSNKTLVWQPRINKPLARSNSMLFRVDLKKDEVKVLWIIPARELWGQYDKGKLVENELISNSIYLFKHDRAKLEDPEPDDLPPWKAQEVLFQYQPQLFRRETLPEDKKHEWDKLMSKRKKKNEKLV